MLSFLFICWLWSQVRTFSNHFCDGERKSRLKATHCSLLQPHTPCPWSWLCRYIHPGTIVPPCRIDEDTKGSRRWWEVEIEFTSEASDGHCAKLVVSVHSLKLWGERHRVNTSCWPSTVPPAPTLQVYSPAGLLAHRLAAQFFPDKGLVQLVVAIHWRTG